MKIEITESHSQHSGSMSTGVSEQFQETTCTHVPWHTYTHIPLHIHTYACMHTHMNLYHIGWAYGKPSVTKFIDALPSKCASQCIHDVHINMYTLTHTSMDKLGKLSHVTIYTYIACVLFSISLQYRLAQPQDCTISCDNINFYQ